MVFRRSAGEGIRNTDHERPGELSRLVVDEITWYMREHKVSRAELAQAMNVSPGRVSQVLSGDENLTLRTLSGIIAALGAEVEFSLRPPEEPPDPFDSSAYDDEIDGARTS
jgi:transcriptional regulator with XRE-family HTH domain